MIKFSQKDSSAFDNLSHMTKTTQNNIESAWYLIGDSVTRLVDKKIISPPKTGRLYRAKRGSRTISHRASASGESPANLTGALRKSVGSKGQGWQKMEIGAGSGTAGGGVQYARRLELGDKPGAKPFIAKRPYLSNSIDEQGSIIANYLESAVKAAFEV